MNIISSYLEILIFRPMGPGSHYEFWVFPRPKTWRLFLGHSGRYSESLCQILAYNLYCKLYNQKRIHCKFEDNEMRPSI